MNQDFRRVAVVNRGEPAMRLIHAVREFNQEHGTDLETIALYTEPDRQALFVREADDSYDLGPAYFVDERDGQRKVRYLDYAALERALVDTGSEAVWVGWGFVAEHPEFAALVERLGVSFIGPTAEVMRRLGDKIMSKKLAEQAQVPVAPWSGGPVASLDEARRQAERIGFPLMVKATAGGGGRGIRAVRSPEELDEAFERARSEALKGFGDSTVFMERLVEGARHIEVQIIADLHGNVWAPGVRDCSIQRRNQKVIEESASPVLDSDQEREVREAAVRLCREAGYTNAGTVEFLYDPTTRHFAFMEVNARLQVEHPVTEATTDLDLVKLQLHVARGGRLEGAPSAARGHAIEARLNAEDPDQGFAPAPGHIALLRLPSGPGIRVDTGIAEGDTIAAEFDSMVAKIIARGRDRNEALARLRRALAETTLVVRGGTTNKAFLYELLGRREVIDGSADVGWLDRSALSGADGRPNAELALIQAAVSVYEIEFEADLKVFLASAARGRPRLPAAVGRAVELRHGGNIYRLDVQRFGGRRYRVRVDGRSVDLVSEPLNDYERRLTVDGRVHRVLVVAEGPDFLVEVDGAPHRVSRDDNGVVRSPAPSVVVSLRVKPGDDVERGQTLAIVEAMKLEMHVSAPFAGKVRELKVGENEQVDAGAPLLRLKPASEAEESSVAERLTFEIFSANGASAVEPRKQLFGLLEELQFLVLGFDVDPATSARLVDDWTRLSRQVPADDEQLLQAEDLLLGRFADLAGLSQRQPEPDDESPLVGRRSAQESLFSYLRSLDARGEGLSTSFLDRLQRALSHYEIASLEPTPALEEVLLWIYKSHARAELQIPAIVAVLQRRLECVDSLASSTDEQFLKLLDRLIDVSHGRFASLADHAREVRYEFFDRPLFDAARREVWAQAERDLEAMAADPQSADRQQRLEALVACPQPLMSLLAERYRRAGEAAQDLIVECITRRYYRIRDLENVRVERVAGRPVFRGEYDHEGRRIHLLTTWSGRDELTRAGREISPLLAEVPDDCDAVIDFYVDSTTAPGTQSRSMLEQIRAALEAVSFPRPVRRLVTALAPSGEFFTFRPDENGFPEEAVYRGLHPMMGKRMHLWRLSNFELRRLHSPEDIYLFHGVAHDNRKDERLFALAEVRDLTPVRDADGSIVALPHLERMLLEALAGIRRFQGRRPPRRRLHWNRVLLFVWPPLDLRADELNRIIYKLARPTAGLGLEKVLVRAQMRRPGETECRDTVLHVSNPAGRGLSIEFREPADAPVQPLTPYRQTVVKMRQRGLHYPYEILRMLTPGPDGQSDFPQGEFVEYDIDGQGALRPVDRPAGGNRANIVVGLITNFTDRYPEGIKRVILLGDPSGALGSLAEPECTRIVKALELAQELGVPLEWFAVSAGAKISMDSGTENMDWIALVLRRIVDFTQAGGEINVIVHGINVGAQPYWNAEATMLMHTRGILIMTHEGAMVLTGKRALDYSGGVSAEDNFGIGGYDRIMGLNGQAQHWARDPAEACHILLRHYEHTYVAPGERFPRRAETTDPRTRDVCSFPYGSAPGGFATVGEVFSPETNPGRKQPFDIRTVMSAVIDQDHPPQERWSAMRDAEIAVVWDARLSGLSVCLIGLESRPLKRVGFVPADGPEQWTAGTLFPLSSKKVARSINAATNNRPLVVLANLSGFDGSPESMRAVQLEYGAEIGRAVVNFRGPIVFCVISRYHGGAFVVFSKRLNDNMEVAALEHTFASVIGGAPAAAVVFAREVDARAKNDPRLKQIESELTTAAGAERGRLRARYDDLLAAVHSEKLGQVADEFDAVHSIQRALKVGSVDRIVPPAQLRPYLIDAVERGMAKCAQHGRAAAANDGDPRVELDPSRVPPARHIGPLDGERPMAGEP